MTAQRRRQFLIAGATGAIVGLAGCGEATDEDSESEDSLTEEGENETAENGDAESGDGSPEQRVDDYLTYAGAYDGEIVDKTGQSSVTVSVGAGDGLSFEPAAIQIDGGTTIVWEWTGEGGAHNVLPNEDSDFTDFGQEEVIDEAGYTVEETFEEDGVGLYYCEPHLAQNMEGAFIVGDGSQTGGEATGNQTGDDQAGEDQTEDGGTS